MDSQKNDFSTSELTPRSVDEGIKQATDPFLRRVEKLCALLASRIDTESAKNSEAFGWRRDNTTANPSGNPDDMVTEPTQVQSTPQSNHAQ